MANPSQEIVWKFMNLFQGNTRGYGYGEGWGAKFNIDKNKGEYDKGAIGWNWGPPLFEQFMDHLTHRKALGIGPLLDDGKTWRGEIDVDKIGNNGSYDMDYVEEMSKIRGSKLPWVVTRTKSSGMRLILFFSEPIEAELVRRGMANLSAQLGYAGNEIFPKQTKLVEKDDCPSWTFLPYGPTFDVFAEQVGMNESGGAMDLEEWVLFAERNSISREEFVKFTTEEHRIKAENKKNGKAASHKSGRWVEEDSYEKTLGSTFWNGPVCLYHISHEGAHSMQHNFLLNVAIFLRKKYPENWDEALAWVNYRVLRPTGDADKLKDLVKTITNRDYDYTCKDEPMCSRCNPYACKRMTFGVGQGASGIDHYELGITVYNSVPQRFFVNVGDNRVACAPNQLLKITLYRELSLANSSTFPDVIPQKEWDRVVRNALENATYVDPPEIMRSNANEIELLEQFLSMHIPTDVRRFGEEFLQGRVGDAVRIKLDEKQIYFKWKAFVTFCRRSMSATESGIDKLRIFVSQKGKEYTRTELRDWYRSTIALPFDLFDEAVVDKWLNQEPPADNIVHFTPR